MLYVEYTDFCAAKNLNFPPALTSRMDRVSSGISR